jgi:hypothetical protein
MSTPTDQFLNAEEKRLVELQKSTDDAMKTQLRTLELNENYRKRYSKYTQILIVITISLFIYLAVSYLQSVVPIIPSIIVDVVALILLLWVAYFIFSTMMEIGSRNPVNYDEINIPPMADSQRASQPAITPEQMNRIRERGDLMAISNVANGATCTGDACCPGKWNRITNLCGFTTLEGAYSEGLTEKVLKEKSSISPYDGFTRTLGGVEI